MKKSVITTMLGLLLAVLLPTAALAAVPTNDDRSGAQTVTELPFSDTQIVDEATIEEGEPTFCGGGQRSVWYRYTAAEDGALVAATEESDYDASIAVYEGSLASMSSHACRYQRGTLAFDVTEGTTYFIQVRDASPDGTRVTPRTLEFNLRRQPRVTVTADERSWSRDSDGRVTVTGVATCSRPVALTIEVSLSQSTDQGTSYSGGTTYVQCESRVRWQMNAPHGYGEDFTGAPAKARVRASVPAESMSLSFTKQTAHRVCDTVGTIGSDSLSGTASRDVICGLAGDDSISSRGGADKIYSGPGADSVQTGAGDDFVYGDEGADTITTGGGNDQVAAGTGNDILRLGDGNDLTHGDAGADRIRGEAGADRLFGDAQADLLVGGTGRDSCTGGTGTDRFESCETKKQ